jgi:hypothetical protein
MAEDDLLGYAITSCYQTLGKFAVSQLVMFLAIIVLLIIIIIMARKLVKVQEIYKLEKSLLIEKISKMLEKEVGKNGNRRQDKIFEEKHKGTGRRNLFDRKSDVAAIRKRS